MAVFGRNRQRDAVETLMVASFFVVSTRMWYVQEHVVFLSILFALTLGSLALGLSLIPRVEGSLRSTPLLLLFGLGAVMLLSSLWSPEFHRTLAYAGFSVLQILIGFSLSRIIRLESFLAGVFLGSVGVGAYSVAVSLSRGLSPWDGDMMKGLFTNQSDLSYILGMGVVTAIPFLGRKKLQTLGFGVAIIFLIVYLQNLDFLTTAVSLASCVAVAVGVAIVRVAPKNFRGKISAGLAIAAGLAISLAWVFRSSLQIAAGKTPDFSGRVPFWQRYWGNIQEEPLLGVGWGFTRDEFGGTDKIMPHQEIFTAHNGYIEVAFILGIPAALLLVSALAIGLFASFVDATKTHAAWLSAGVPIFVTYLIVHDFTGSWLPRVIGLFLMGAIFGFMARSRKSDK